jgi:hypothetical protein
MKVGRVRLARRAAAEAERRRAEEERVRRQCEAELRRRREDLQERQKSERARVERLLSDAAAWRQITMLREYIARVEQFVLERDGRIAEGTDVAWWLAWASQQADRFDTITPSPPSVLDGQV